MNKGFTLIETVIVMVVTVIIAAVVITRWNYDPIKLNSAARKTAEDIRYVQKLSVSSQTRAGITFNANGYNVYSNITVLTAAASPGDPCSTNAANNFTVDFSAARCSQYQGVQITLPVTNPIAFNSLGKPVSSAGADIVAQTVTLSYKGTNKSVFVEAGTGRVSY